VVVVGGGQVELAQDAADVLFHRTLADVEPARDPLQRVDELDGGAVTSAIHATTLLALEAFQTGQWDDAQRLTETATGLSETRGYQLLRWNAQVAGALLAAAAARPPQADERLTL